MEVNFTGVFGLSEAERLEAEPLLFVDGEFVVQGLVGWTPAGMNEWEWMGWKDEEMKNNDTLIEILICSVGTGGNEWMEWKLNTVEIKWMNGNKWMEINWHEKMKSNAILN